MAQPGAISLNIKSKKKGGCEEVCFRANCGGGKQMCLIQSNVSANGYHGNQLISQ